MVISSRTLLSAQVGIGSLAEATDKANSNAIVNKIERAQCREVCIWSSWVMPSN
jgi:hypothetical protein